MIDCTCGATAVPLFRILEYNGNPTTVRIPSANMTGDFPVFRDIVSLPVTVKLLLNPNLELMKVQFPSNDEGFPEQIRHPDTPIKCIALKLRNYRTHYCFSIYRSSVSSTAARANQFLRGSS